MGGKQFYAYPLNLLTAALRGLWKETDMEVAELQRDKNICYPSVHSTHHAQRHKDSRLKNTGRWKKRGWNHRICSWFSIAHVPGVTAFVFRDGISRCSRQRNTAVSFDALAEHILRINRNSRSRCLASGKGPVLINSWVGFFNLLEANKNFLRQKDASLLCSQRWQSSSAQNEGLRLHCASSWIFKKS